MCCHVYDARDRIFFLEKKGKKEGGGEGMTHIPCEMERTYVPDGSVVGVQT